MKKYLLSISVALLFVAHLVYQYYGAAARNAVGGVSALSVNHSQPVAITTVLTPPASGSTPPAPEPAPVVATPPPASKPVATPPPTPAPVATPPPPPPVPKGQYTDGTYTGQRVDAFYGYVTVQAIIAGGRLSDVQFLEYPSDQGHSREVSNYAIPRLAAEAIVAQSAHVDIISGATSTSEAFVQSLASALVAAKS